MQRYEEKSLVYRISRSIYFFDEVTASSVSEAIKLLEEIRQESVTKKINKPIEFIIKTDGGDAYDAFALYDKLRRSEYEVITVGTGLVASAGVLIYLAGDRRILTENARLMAHQVWSSTEGKSSDIQIDAKETSIVNRMYQEIIADRTGMSITKIHKEFKLGDKYLSVEEAMEDGYTHEMLKNKRTRRYKKKK